jgi:hypothetical protein
LDYFVLDRYGVGGPIEDLRDPRFEGSRNITAMANHSIFNEDRIIRLGMVAVQGKFGDIAAFMHSHTMLVHNASFQGHGSAADPAGFRERFLVHNNSC